MRRNREGPSRKTRMCSKLIIILLTTKKVRTFIYPPWGQGLSFFVGTTVGWDLKVAEFTQPMKQARKRPVNECPASVAPPFTVCSLTLTRDAMLCGDRDHFLPPFFPLPFFRFYVRPDQGRVRRGGRRRRGFTVATGVEEDWRSPLQPLPKCGGRWER